jgi:hypothetical protein
VRIKNCNHILILLIETNPPLLSARVSSYATVSIESIISQVRLTGPPTDWKPPVDYRGPEPKALFQIDKEDYKTVTGFWELRSKASTSKSRSGAVISTIAFGEPGASSSCAAPLRLSAGQASSEAVEGGLRELVPVRRAHGKRNATRAANFS